MIKICLLTFMLVLSTIVNAQTRARKTERIGTIIDSVFVFYDRTTIVRPDVRIKEGVSVNALKEAFEMPLQIIKINNGKEKWVYDSTIVYINNGVVDAIRHMKK